MIIIGFDPGYHRVGWGVIAATKREMRAVAYGCIQTDKELDLPERLLHIYRDTKKILEKHKPSFVVIEKLYFAQSVTTALKVSEARGVLLLATAECGVPVYEITPAQVKQTLTGFGGAKKFQMQEMVKRIFNMEEIPKPDDAADGLAMAYVGAVRVGAR